MKYTLFAWILALTLVANSALAQKSGAKLEGWFNSSKSWGGTVQASNSKYTERDTVPLRFTANLAPGTHTLLLKFDFKDSGGQKRFFDSLGSYNATITNVSLTAGTSFSGLSNYVAIPTDTSLLPTYAAAQVPGVISLYPLGLTATAGSYSNINGIRVLPVKLVVPGTGTTLVPILLGYGGHLATESLWGLGNGASKWPGASGKQFASIDGSSDLNVSVNPGAIIPSADLSLTIASPPQPVNSGSDVTYNIAIVNSGPNQATSVKVTNTLPAGVTFVSANPTQPIVAGSKIAFSLGSINPNVTTNITVTGRLSAGQCLNITDEAFVTSAVLDPNTLNNSKSVTSTVADKTPPTITTCAPARTAIANASCQAAVPDFTTGVSAVDNCTAASSLAKTQSPVAGTLVGPGTTTVTITVKDTANNIVTCPTSFTVNDTAPPTITLCPPAQTASANASCQAAVPDFTTGVTAVDNCTTASSLAKTQSPVAGTLVGLGTTTVTITVKDTANNIVTCPTSFTVNDTAPPTITLCPPAQTASANASCQAAVPDFTTGVTAVDNCTTASSLAKTQSPAAGTLVGLGTTTVTITVKDTANNIVTCPTSFTVNDTTPPAIACPAPIIVDVDPDACGMVVNFTCPTATDNCDGPVAVECDPPSSTYLPIGTHQVVATAKDSKNNTSQCTFIVVVLDAGNRAWPLAQDLPLQAGANGLKEANFTQCLVALDQSRWYKFKVTPGSRVVVTLSGLKENFDLVLYKDIKKVYQDLLTETDATHLSAEFAADAFSASAFSGDAFSASAFSASAFSASAFSASAFSASAFSASAFSASAFSASAFSADSFAASAFSPDEFSASAFSASAFSDGAFSASAFSASAFSASAFSASAFSASAFSASAFSSAQMQSIVAGSAFEGIANEGVIANTWNESGDFYIRVRGRNGVFSPGDPFQVNVYQYPSACEGVVTVPFNNNGALPASGFKANAGGYKTLIVTDSTRWTPGPAVMGELQLFAARPEVKGVIVDVSGDSWVNFFNTQADAKPDCPFAKNLVAEAIKNVIDRSRAGNSLEYVVIVGSDKVIPFFRFPDEALLGPEKNYVPPVKNLSPSEASLKYNYVPSQDFYGAACDLSLKTMKLPLPDLAVGRLAETPAEVLGMLAAYLDTADGSVVVTSSLVTGYDFLEDSSLAFAAELEQGIGGNKNDTLMSANTLAPELCWTADDLREKLFGPRHDIVYLAGHFSAGSALAADFDTTVLASELAESSTDFKNTLIVSAGCHSGYDLVDEDGFPIVSPNPDWVQAAARKKATLVAGTGYQYGDTDFIEYSERLYLELAKQLRTGDPGTVVPIGKALNAAKLIYLAGTPQMRGIHTKAYLEATLYGLPMLSFQLPNKTVGIELDPAASTPTAYTEKPGSVFDLKRTDLTVTPGLHLKELEMKNVDPAVIGTVTGTYFEGGSGIINNPAEPILPVEVRSVGFNGTALRGVGFRGGSYTDIDGLVPVTGAATTEIRGVHATFVSEVFYPMQFWNVNYFGALCGLGDGATRLVTIPAQFKSSSTDVNTGTFRKFGEMQFRLFYSDDLDDHGINGISSIPGITGPPAISAIKGISSTSPNGTQVEFSARVVGNPSAGIQEVWVTYTATEGGFYGLWQSLNLVQDPIDSTLWKKTLDLGTTPSLKLRYMVSAVTGTGAVSVDSKLGAYHIPDEFDSGNTANLPDTSVLLAADNLINGAYADTVTFRATLTLPGGALVAGRRLVFSLGDQEIWAFTDSGGVATARIQIRTEPGEYDVKASFTGGDNLAPSFDSKPFTIRRQSISLTTPQTEVYVKPGTDTKILAYLKDGAGNYILERSMIFVVCDSTGNPVYAKPVITGISGRARFGILPEEFTDGTYTVKAYFNGAITLPGDNHIYLDDTRYEIATQEFFIITMHVDGTAPSLNCQDITVNNDPGYCTAVVSYAPTVNDANPASVVCSPASGTPFAVGSTLVTCTATDAAGNVGLCTFNLIVKDKEIPAITCPAPIEVNTPTGANKALVNFSVTATDICGPVTVATSAASGSSFPIGTTTVSATATDIADNTSSCTFTVTVKDKEIPAIICPGDITKIITTSANSQVVNYDVTATDNDSIQSLVVNPASGFAFPVGTTTVNATATDRSGNTSTCNFKVNVVYDNIPPVATITASPNILRPPNHQMVLVTVAVTSTDNLGGVINCQILSVISSDPDNGLGDGDQPNDIQFTGLTNPLQVYLRSERVRNGPGRTYTITVQCTDTSGNSSTATATVFVPPNGK